jgi:hypothetical protein
MKKQKLQKLFELARNESAPAPPADFVPDVLRAIRHEPRASASGSSSVFDQLNLLFPRIALATTVVIALCIAADFGLTTAGMPDLSDGMSQISAQWFLTPGGL